MARIAGVNIPTNKRVIIALTYIHGIGRKTAVDIANQLGIDQSRCRHLTGENGFALVTIKNGDRVFLAWELQEPEEDPGLFSVWVNRPGEVVYGLVAGPVLKTDPRSLTTGTTVDLLRAVITDERLRLLTTADVVAASEQVQRWKKQ